jgi:hypothetical protein
VTSFVIPGEVTIAGEGRGITFFHTTLWATLGVDPMVTIDGGDRNTWRAFLEEPFYAGPNGHVKMQDQFGDDESKESTLGAISELLYDQDTQYKNAIARSKDAHQGVVAVEYPRKAFFIKAMTSLLVLSPNEWHAKQLTGFDGLVKEWDTELFLPVVAAMTSACQDPEAVNKFKKGMGVAKHNAAFLCQLMDLLADHLTRDGDGQKEGGEAGGSGRVAPKGATVAASADISLVLTKLEELTGQVKSLQQQVSLHGAAGALGKHSASSPAKSRLEGGKGNLVRVSGKSHLCAYNIMNVGGSHSLDQGAELKLSDDNANMAREEVVVMAKKAFEADASAFKVVHGDYDKFLQKVLEPTQGTDTWPGHPEFKLYTKAFPEVDFRIKSMGDDRRVVTSPTAPHEGVQPKWVMFPLFGITMKGHYDMGSISVGGEDVFFFSQAEAVAAEKLIDVFLTGRQVIPAGSAGKKMGSDEFRSVVRAALAASTQAQGTPWQVVGNKKKKKVVSFGPAPNAQATAHAQAVAVAQQVQQDAAVAAQIQASQASAVQAAQATQAVQVSKAAQAATHAQAVAVNAAAQMQAEMVALRSQVHAQQVQLAHAQAHAHTQAQVQAATQAVQPPFSAPYGGQGSYVMALGAQTGAPLVVPAQMGPPVAHPAVIKQHGASSALDKLLVGSGGSAVVPVMVVFGKDSKKKVKKAMEVLHPAAYAAAVSWVKAGQDTPSERFVVHAKDTDAPLVQELIQLLKNGGVGAAPYRASGGGGGLVARSKTGMMAASARTGVCHSYSSGVACRFGDQCHFTCYNGPATR